MLLGMQFYKIFVTFKSNRKFTQPYTRKEYVGTPCIKLNTLSIILNVIIDKHAKCMYVCNTQ